MLGVLAAPAAVLRELQPFLGVLLVFCRRIIFSLAHSARKRDYFAHLYSTLQKAQTPPFPEISGKTKRGILPVLVTLEGV
jgi:hypothetical protein